MIWSMDTKNAMHEAVQIAGGVVALTRLLGLKNYQTVQQWAALFTKALLPALRQARTF